jgi:hypothetical protein
VGRLPRPPFNHGETPVGINCGATGSSLTDLLSKSAFGDEALAAYKKLPSGASLESAKEPTHDNPLARILQVTIAERRRKIRP